MSSLTTLELTRQILTGKDGEKQWGTSEIIQWLESPEGERWSRCTHSYNRINLLVSVKNEDTDILDEYAAILWRV